jgi:hypothetical protein
MVGEFGDAVFVRHQNIVRVRLLNGEVQPDGVGIGHKRPGDAPTTARCR